MSLKLLLPALLSPLLLFGLLTLSSATTAQRASYQELCNATVKCDKRIWLTCENGMCACKQKSMLFEPVRTLNLSTGLQRTGGCAVKAGERCKFAMEENEDGKPLFELLPCVINAECDHEGVCSCKSDFFEDPQGQCQHPKKLNENCNSTIKCSKMAGLECRGGICQCDGKTSFYDHSLGRCVGLAGSPCKKFMCIENATCQDGKCECAFDHYRNRTNFCLPKVLINGSCTEDAECAKDFLSNTLLRCVNGRCACDPARYVYATVQRSSLRSEYTGAYYFDGYEGAQETLCAPKPGLPCVRSRCAPGAYCFYDEAGKYNQYFKFNEATAKGTCNCEPGTVISQSSGLCAKPHKAVCESAKDCVAGLACVQSRCRCKYRSQIYDQEKQLCVSRAHGPCRNTTECRPGAECELVPGTGTGRGHCRCLDGSVANAEGECEAAFGTPCNVTTVCDTVAELVCIDGKCQCSDFAYFDDYQRRCLGFVGTQCNHELNDCVQGAHCVKLHEKLKGRCYCREEFVEDGEYGCFQGYENSSKDRFLQATQLDEARSRGR